MFGGGYSPTSLATPPPPTCPLISLLQKSKKKPLPQTQNISVIKFKKKMFLYGLAMMIIREQMNRYNIDEFNLQLGMCIIKIV